QSSMDWRREMIGQCHARAWQDTRLAQWWRNKTACRSLPPKAIADLRNKLRGRIILPGDAGYDDARMLKNPRFDPRPSAIVLCAVESDVGHILDALRRFGLSFTVRSGGHSTAGYSASDGVLVDVRGLNTIVVNASAKTATVGVGCTNGEVHQALSPHGLH